MERWKGEVALVTGASSGIGRAVAERLLAAGMRVAVWGRRRERLQQVVASHGARALPQSVDLRDTTAVVAGVADCQAALGPVSVLVNAAGLGQTASLCDGEVEAWREMFDVNVVALSLVTREVVRRLLERRAAGHVIHIGSLSGHRVPASAAGPYAATKFAVRALAETLRVELRRRASPIRVTCVSPGFVETEFHANYYGDEQRARELYAQQRVLTAADVADAVVHVLAAPDHVDTSDVLLRSVEQVS